MNRKQKQKFGVDMFEKFVSVFQFLCFGVCFGFSTLLYHCFSALFYVFVW
jgi:hypothetical protein